LILAAKPRVEVLSPTALAAGLSVHITEMRALPDKQGCSIRVSFELRYGTWSLIFKKSKPIAASGTVETATHDFPLDAFSASVAITVPRVSRLKYATSQRTACKLEHIQWIDLVLIYFPSRVRSLSLVAFSEPAKSIRF